MRKQVFEKISALIHPALQQQIDSLLCQPDKGISLFQQLKSLPAIPSFHGLIALGKKLDILEKIGLSALDLSWLNNNYQPTLSKYAQQGSIDRLIQLKPDHRYAVLVCFFKQIQHDTQDHLVDMYFKLMNRIENSAEQQANEALRASKKMVKKSLKHFQVMTTLLLDESIPDDQLRLTLFEHIEKEELARSLHQTETWLEGPAQHNLFFMMKRFSYLRQFTPHFLKHLTCKTQDKHNKVVVKAITLLNTLNTENKRDLPQDTPTKFIPKNLLPYVVKDNIINRKAWECVLFSKLKHEIKNGNIAIQGSKRFCTLEEFFMPSHEWEGMRYDFFNRANLPAEPSKVSTYLKKYLNSAFDRFFDRPDQNTYATIEGGKWVIASDKAESLSPEEAQSLSKLKAFLASFMRSIKLPNLLIEVDNDIHFTSAFMAHPDQRQPDEICNILATLMAHGCFIGSYTMARLTPVSYAHIKRITDWQMTEDSQRQALSLLVHAISALDITHHWGQGRTSSIDGQRFTYRRKTLTRTYSKRFRDFGLEFYTFVADNYAPFYSKPIEATDRDAPHVLDGLLYNTTDLPLEEHYVDTHGYTEINFAAFAMFGKKFSPRIKGVKHQIIYKIDRNKDYKKLAPLLSNTINMSCLVEQWDSIGHFYASLEKRHVTASTALKRLNAFSAHNQFYKANRELGRIFKTESILDYLSDPLLRKNQRHGLLKGAQIHQLARHVAYGKRGRITLGNFQEQKNTCSCLTLIMACIIYW